ncbi:hypothetical protein OH77DRAFT_1440316 [Trametes cingulata]|nr:hypothetical protein OH77DRAFT_1440316 [Trametes cingulata]
MATTDSPPTSLAHELLSSQLAVLYQHAKQRADGFQEGNEDGRHALPALARFVLSNPAITSSARFVAEFRKPVLKYIEDDLSLLVFDIENVHGSFQAHNVVVYCLVRVSPVTLHLDASGERDDSVVSYRFDLETAVLLPSFWGSADGAGGILDAQRSMLDLCMGKYLELLRAARLDAYSVTLPVFLRRDRIPPREAHVPPDAVSPIAEFNELMRFVWPHDNPSAPPQAAWRAIYDWANYSVRNPVPTVNFIEVKSGPPQLACPWPGKCAIVYVDIRKIRIQLAGEQRIRVHEGWRVAFCTRISSAHQNGVTNVAFQFSRRCRVVRELSRFPEADRHNRLEDIFRALQGLKMQDVTVPVPDRTAISRPLGPNPEYPGGIWIVAMNQPASLEALRRTNLVGLDRVVAISQDSINAYIADLYEQRVPPLGGQKSGGLAVTAKVHGIRISLQSRDQVVVWVHVEPVIPLGKSRANGGKGKETERSDILPASSKSDLCLAFRVELALLDHQSLTGASSETLQKSPVVQEYGGNKNYVLKHLVLDLKNAQYVQDYSWPIDKSIGDHVSLPSLHEYIVKDYFPALCREGLNVIATIPVWHAEGNAPRNALRSVDYVVYGEDAIRRDTEKQHSDQATLLAESLNRYEYTGNDETKNTLSVRVIPLQHPPSVHIDGQTTVRRSSGDSASSTWASLKWSLVLKIELVDNAIRIRQSEAMSFSGPESSAEDTTRGGFSVELGQLLRESLNFSGTVAIDPAQRSTEPLCVDAPIWPFLYPPGGAYKLGEAMFNENGDLLVELCRADLGENPEGTTDLAARRA